MTASALHPSPAPLRVERMPLARSLELGREAPGPFGALSYGRRLHVPWMSSVQAKVLSEAGPMTDLWTAGARVESGTTGVVRWRSDGHWLLGAVDLDEAAEKDGLQELARRSYANLFQVLQQSQCPHLLRLWNYLPQINADGGGLERYRQFNAGRQQAFLDAGQAAFEGAPAACAIGLHKGRLCLRFLAGRLPPLPVENPRQVSAYHYPADYGPRPPTFSRAALAPLGGGEVALFISGTASIVGHETVHRGDVKAQLQETLTNLRTVVAEANRRTTARFDLADTELVVYVRHPEHAPGIRADLVQALGADAHALRRAVFLEADICRSDLLVEIEAHATAPGELRPGG